MGAYVGDEAALLPSHATDNPTGYWERADIVAYHDAFLTSCGYAWNEVAGFAAARLDSTARLLLSDELRQVIDVLSRAGHSWLVKDPRLCLLLTQWLPLLEGPACIVVVRDPRKIAMSTLREGLRGAYTSHFILSLWEKYLRTALEGLQGKQVLFVSYDRLVIDPVAESARLLRGTRELGAADLQALASEQLHALLDTQLARSEAAPNAELSNDQALLFDWLDRQCRVASVVTVEKFPTGDSSDSTLWEYANIRRHIAETVRHHELANIASDARSAVAAVSGLQEQLAAARLDALDKSARSNEHLRKQVDELQKQNDQISIALKDAHAERRRLGESEVRLQTRLTQESARADAAEAARNDLQAQVDHLKRAVAKLESECESLRRSRERALDAAVKARRALDEKLVESPSPRDE